METLLKPSEVVNVFATAIFVKDRQHRCVMLNDECCRLRGHARKFLLGKTDYDLLPKEKADKTWALEERVFLTGVEQYDEETLPGRRGSRTYSTTMVPFTDKSGGAWLVGIISDITAHVRALEECRYTKSVLEAQNDASIAGILLVDEGGRIVSFNRAFREMWSISAKVLALKSDAAALRAVMDKIADPSAFRRRVAHLYRHPDEKSSDEIVLRDGRIFDRYSAPVVSKEGVRYGRVWHFRDVTDMRRMAGLDAEVKQRRKLDGLKDQFIGTVSHELRTPLTVVRTAIDTLRGGAAGRLTPKQMEVADLCSRNILRLSKMIKNLLDISRLESGNAKARLERLDLRPLLKDMEANFRLLKGGKDVAIEIDAPPGLPRVKGDPEMIGEMLYNLLDNAARFARGAVRVKARRERGFSGGRETPGVRVEIVDDGPGIPPDRLGLLFNKFTQVERAVGGDGYKGTGLGLAICKQIMTLHGSRITADNAPGRGARFRFFLPEWPART